MKLQVFYGSYSVGIRIIYPLTKLNGVHISSHLMLGSNVMQLLNEKNPDIVIIDAQLEEDIALVVSTKSKNHIHHPLVMIVAQASDLQDRQEYLHAGADYYFHFPEGIEELCTVISELEHRDSVVLE